jgi:hypothetical protein
MKGSKKKPAGVSKVMDEQGKETIVESLISFFSKSGKLNEDSVIPSDRADYGRGSQIETADGKGIVIEKRGSIVVVEMEDGSEKTFTLNVLDKHNAMNRFDDEPKPEEKAKDAEKAERDQMWKDRDQKNYPVFGGMTADPKSSTQDLLKKLKGLLEKLKMKKVAVDIIKAKTAQGSDEVIDTVPAGQGNKAIQDLKKKIGQKGGSVTSLKATTVK